MGYDYERELEGLQAMLSRSETVIGGSPESIAMTQRAYDIRRLTIDLNCTFHTHEEIIDIFSKIIEKPVPSSFGLFPPFYTEYGKNISVGENVFINAGCKFQDHGGIVLEDGVLVGHNVVIATLNHGQDPSDRQSLIPSPVRICEGAWIGAGAVICPGVTVGKHSIVAAGAVVVKDVPDGVIVGGVPAKVLKHIDMNNTVRA